VTTDAKVRSARWISADPDGLLISSWGDQNVAYQKASGLTHFLNESSVRILLEILLTAKTTHEIAQELAGHDYDTSLEDISRQLEGILLRFEELGLIDREIEA